MDSWIDDLDMNRASAPCGITPGITADVTMGYLVQQSLPRVQIPEFDGSASLWIEFITKFRDMVHLPAYLSDSQRKTYLIQHLGGKAKRAVMAYKNDWRGYVLALKRLKYLFGQRSEIAEETLKKVTEGKTIDSGDQGALSEFYFSVNDCLETLK